MQIRKSPVDKSYHLLISDLSIVFDDFYEKNIFTLSEIVLTFKGFDVCYLTSTQSKVFKLLFESFKDCKVI